MRPPARHLFATALVASAACTHAPPKMSFAEAGLLDPVEPVAPPPPPVEVPAPRKVASEPPSGAPIDAALLRFTAEARSRRRRAGRASGFPLEAEQAWAALNDELDRYLLRPLPQTPIVELTRARVTIDAELDYDRRRYGEPPRELAGRVAAEIARLDARLRASRALARTVRARAMPPPLVWPIEHAALSSPFGVRLHPLDHERRMHWGIDLATSKGRIVTSAAPGIVVRAGWTFGYGLLVEVRHSGDLTTRYSHLEHLLCAPGDDVAAGQPLGLVGDTGRATGPHLHFEVWSGGRARDPLDLLGSPIAAGDAGW